MLPGTLLEKVASEIVHMEPLRGPSGDVIGITGAATDVTAQKQVQEALADALAFRDRMLGILGHDLRNPVAAVRTAATLLLRREGLDDDTRELAAAIDWSGKRMLEMIESLLDFSETRFKGALPISPCSIITSMRWVRGPMHRQRHMSKPGCRTAGRFLALA